MGSTVWKKSLEMIVTSIEDNKYFDKVGEYYHLKHEVCALDTIMFTCVVFDKMSTYEVEFKGETSTSEYVATGNMIVVEKCMIDPLPTIMTLFERDNPIFISELGFKPLMDTKIIKTIVLAKNVTENNLKRAREEAYKIYNELK